MTRNTRKESRKVKKESKGKKEKGRMKEETCAIVTKPHRWVLSSDRILISIRTNRI